MAETLQAVRLSTLKGELDINLFVSVTYFLIEITNADVEYRYMHLHTSSLSYRTMMIVLQALLENVSSSYYRFILTPHLTTMNCDKT